MREMTPLEMLKPDVGLRLPTATVERSGNAVTPMAESYPNEETARVRSTVTVMFRAETWRQSLPKTGCASRSAIPGAPVRVRGRDSRMQP